MATALSSSSDRIRVVIVDDHELVRRGIRDMLRDDPGIEVVGEAGSRAEALGVIEETKPNVAILDMRLPDGTGMDVCRAAKTSAPATKVIVLSAYDDPGYVAAAVSLGAAGYLSKTVSATELSRAVHKVAQGWLLFGPDAAGRVRTLVVGSDSLSPATSRHCEELTRREAEVLSHMCLGLTNADIARALGIAVKTVEEHMEHVLRKLGARNRTQALAIAIRKGWLQTTSDAECWAGQR